MHAVGQVARWLERADPPRSARATPYAAVVRGLAWHLRVGGAWRALPSGLVHWRTAYGWLRRWLGLGLFEALLRQVAGLRRRAAGRKPEPRLAVIDTQSVECIPVRGPRGYDAAKKVLGRKRGVSKTWGRLVPDHGGGRDVADGAAAGEGEPERGEDDGAGADQPEMGKQPAPRFLTLPYGCSRRCAASVTRAATTRCGAMPGVGGCRARRCLRPPSCR